MSISASSVSASLRRAGFNPIANGSRREGIVVVGMGDDRVSVRINIDAEGAASRMRADVLEALGEQGYLVDSDGGIFVTGRKVRVATEDVDKSEWIDPTPATYRELVDGRVFEVTLSHDSAKARKSVRSSLEQGWRRGSFVAITPADADTDWDSAEILTLKKAIAGYPVGAEFRVIDEIPSDPTVSYEVVPVAIEINGTFRLNAESFFAPLEHFEIKALRQIAETGKTNATKAISRSLFERGLVNLGEFVATLALTPRGRSIMGVGDEVVETIVNAADSISINTPNTPSPLDVDPDPTPSAADGPLSAPADYVGPLAAADVTPDDVRGRADQIWIAWHRLEEKVKDELRADPGERRNGVDDARRAAEEQRDYLIEYVDVHGLTYSEFDPRNSREGVADHFEIRDADDLVVETSSTIPVELRAGHTVEALDDEGRALLAAATHEDGMICNTPHAGGTLAELSAWGRGSAEIKARS